jgi:hypothetical protein
MIDGGGQQQHNQNPDQTGNLSHAYVLSASVSPKIRGTGLQIADTNNSSMS